MTVANIVKLINIQLAGELLLYKELEPFLDEVIDDINAQLDTRYPTFSEFTSTSGQEEYAQYPDYDFFPEKYIREVVAKGAAYKYYVMDEEGIPTAQMYQYNYQDQLFRMLRDYLEDVPPVWKAYHKASVHNLNDVAWKEPWITNGYL